MTSDKSISIDSQRINIRDQHLILLPQKAIFWEERSYLILTDLHLGKAGHFRKAGIPIPRSVHQADLQCLQQLIERHQPTAVLMLGDLFHSEINNEWNDFRLFLQQNAGLNFLLVKGNHDILPENAYQEDNLKVYQEHYCYGPFHFSHHPLEKEEIQSGLYNMAGHVHPGYKVSGRRGQHIKLPSFHFSTYGALLPAFGRFTGCVHIPKEVNDEVYIIVPKQGNESKIMKIK
ncbi:ligase-associated DNA damage response endonuclease PdeM [Porifericola rhodea]|uniref:ligase-associated DNA damage response endonuclease PdeM n=1 Tax=Porifericola rhodea TaxID=930972 RepID=UPI0026668321|nr:ligase-associated DNA damage response endonuclease PdeM [Porifericola rhodea]WKN31322.1 ligase-associated DNA damage response endonuclease PdeM [Porifericola rhodea]